MTVLALIEPQTLVGEELRRSLGRRHDLWDEIRLFSTDPVEVGAVSEAGQRPALVQAMTPEALRAVDLAIFCARRSTSVSSEVSNFLGGVAILVDPQPPPESSPAVVAGVNLHRVVGQRILISPNPGVILLAHLLSPLLELDVLDAVAHLQEPVSTANKEGLDELLEQTRAILSMTPQPPTNVFPVQLAFNTVPVGERAGGYAGQLFSVLEGRIPVAVQATQAGVFHCLATWLLVRFAADPGVDRVRERLAANEVIEIATEEEFLGPIRAAASDRVMIGSITPASSLAGAYWIWSVMDNLTCGGASNVLAIAETVLATKTALS